MIDAQLHQEILYRLKQAEQQHNLKILLAIASGSRAWEVVSRNSDYDVRFIYMYELAAQATEQSSQQQRVVQTLGTDRIQQLNTLFHGCLNEYGFSQQDHGLYEHDGLKPQLEFYLSDESQHGLNSLKKHLEKHQDNDQDSRHSNPESRCQKKRRHMLNRHHDVGFLPCA